MDWEGRLSGMRTLEKNWDSYGADPPTAEVLDKAEHALRSMGESSFLKSVNPSVVGGVGLTFRRPSESSRYAYIEFRNTDSVHLLLAIQTREPEVYAFGPDTEERPILWHPLLLFIERWLTLDLMLRNPEIK